MPSNYAWLSGQPLITGSVRALLLVACCETDRAGGSWRTKLSAWAKLAGISDRAAREQLIPMVQAGVLQVERQGHTLTLQILRPEGEVELKPTGCGRGQNSEQGSENSEQSSGIRSNSEQSSGNAEFGTEFRKIRNRVPKQDPEQGSEFDRNPEQSSEIRRSARGFPPHPPSEGGRSSTSLDQEKPGESHTTRAPAHPRVSNAPATSPSNDGVCADAAFGSFVSLLRNRGLSVADTPENRAKFDRLLSRSAEDQEKFISQLRTMPRDRWPLNRGNLGVLLSDSGIDAVINFVAPLDPTKPLNAEDDLRRLCANPQPVRSYA